MIKRYFPDSRSKWLTYIKIFLPIILGSTLFALNGFVDNFMVGKYNGVAALSAANSWTNILIGLIIGVAGAGSVILAQFYHSRNYKIAREIIRLRYLITMVIALSMAILAWTIPNTLNSFFLKGAVNDPQQIKNIAMAREYIQIIAIQWLLLAITFNLGNHLREIGHSKVVMIWGIGTLSANILLNSILMYVFDLGVAGAAWASVAGRVVALVWGTVYIFKKRLEIAISPFSLFSISKSTIKEFFKRWFLMFSLATAMIFITFRTYFYDLGYPTGSIGLGVGAMTVYGLSGAIQNVFTTTFNALAIMSANFVGSELGKGNIKQARINSDQLKGFNTLMSSFLSLMLLVIAFLVPFFTFLVDPSDPDIDTVIQLENVKYTLLVVAAFYPMWIWFSTSYRNAVAGGRGFWFAFVDWIVSGPIQLTFLFLMVLFVVPNSDILQASFPLMYAIFFLTDFLKLILIEILYYKSDWAHSITKQQLLGLKAEAVDEINTAIDKPL